MDSTAHEPLRKHWHCPVVRFCFCPVTICAAKAAPPWLTMRSSCYLPPLFATRRSHYVGRVFLVFVGSFPRARLFDAASRTTYEKGKPTGRKFITREQQVITLKADFSEQLRGRKRMHGTALWFSR